MPNKTPIETLQVTEFLDWDSPVVEDYTNLIIGSDQDPVKQMVKLFYAVRDRIRYDVYGVDMSREGLKASHIIKNKVGFCIHKSIVFATAARYLGIPSRLTFSDVRNHLSTPALKKLVGGDVFHYHAYAEIYLHERWIKATPVFNLMLCHLFKMEPLEFDGIHDATLQAYDKQGNQSLEFINHHGSFNNVPYQQCITALKHHHPLLFMNGDKTATGNLAHEQISHSRI